jgi:hypothetical protein
MQSFNFKASETVATGLRDHRIAIATYWWRTRFFLGWYREFTHRIPLIGPQIAIQMTNVITCQSSQCLNGNPPSRLECPTCNKYVYSLYRWIPVHFNDASLC